MRLLVVGAGATGGYFGGRLAEAGRDVTFLLRPARANQVRHTGLRVKSPHGDLALAPTVVTAGEIDGPYDAVLLTVKAYGLDAAMQDFAPAIGSESLILPVLNGFRHMDVLAARFGERAVVGCVCKIAAQLDEDGGIVQFARFHEIAYGERDGSASDRMQRLDAFMRGAGFDARLSTTIEREMWEKWVLLASLGSMGALMRGTVGEIVAAPGGLDFVHALLDEVVAVVRAAGVAPSESFLAAAKQQLTAPGSPFTSSMFRDLQEGKPIEAEQIVGDLVLRALKVGVPTPLLSAAYTSLCIYQAQRGT